jgi:hypothetical protein
MGCAEIDGKLRLASNNGWSEWSCRADSGIAGSEVDVEVVDATGAALPGAQVLAAAGAAILETRTSERGTARLLLEPGRWQLTVSLPGFLPLQRRVDLASVEACRYRAILAVEHTTDLQ